MRQGRADKNGRESWKVEPKSRAADPEGVAQQGLSVQFEKAPVLGGRGYSVTGPRPAAAGPGGGRTIHKSGSQGHQK